MPELSIAKISSSFIIKNLLIGKIFTANILCLGLQSKRKVSQKILPLSILTKNEEKVIKYFFVGLVILFSFCQGYETFLHV